MSSNNAIKYATGLAVPPCLRIYAILCVDWLGLRAHPARKAAVGFLHFCVPLLSRWSVRGVWCRIVLMGQGGVGKTAMVTKFTTGDFNEAVRGGLFVLHQLRPFG